MAAQPRLRLAVIRAIRGKQRPEARRVIHHLEVADLVPDDVVEDRLGRQQQPPVEAHRAAARAARPARPLAADREPRIRARRRARRRASSRGAISSRAARWYQRSSAGARRHRRPARAAPIPRRCTRVRPRCGATSSSSPRYGTVVAPRGHRRGARARPRRRRRSIHGASSRIAAAASRSGARRGSTTSTPRVGVDRHPHAASALRASDPIS